MEAQEHDNAYLYSFLVCNCAFRGLSIWADISFLDGKMTGLKVTEEQHQRSVTDWWAWACKRYRVPEHLLYHPPGEGVRTPAFATRLKLVGWRKGMPDLQLFVPSARYHALFIEMKSLKGRPEKEQLVYLSDLRTQGYAACICYGDKAAITCITDYMDGKEIPEKM